jgi:hypothetical protein
MRLKPEKPPGKKLVKRMSLRTKYWLLGTASALMIGSGLSILCEAAFMKFSGEPTIRWFLTGSYAFILIIGGLGLMQTATRFRTMIDVRREVRRAIKKAALQKTLASKASNKKETPAP